MQACILQLLWIMAELLVIHQGSNICYGTIQLNIDQEGYIEVIDFCDTYAEFTFDQWFDGDGIDYILNKIATQLYININTIVRNNYVHPELFKYLAADISDEMLVQVTEMLKQYHSKVTHMEPLYCRRDDCKQKRKERVLPLNRAAENCLILFKNNGEEEDWQYSCRRVMRNNISACMTQHHEDYPDSEIILRLDNVPNAVRLWKQVKNKYKRKMYCRGIHFDLKRVYVEGYIVKKIKKIHRKRLY
jgi:hypothetical protein